VAQTHRTWRLGWEDEGWWSRLAHPEHQIWGEGATPLRWQELERPKADHVPTALACYGLLVRHHLPTSEQMVVRFVSGRPDRALTMAFVAGGSARLAAQGVTALLGWENAACELEVRVCAYYDCIREAHSVRPKKALSHAM
jgi:hypothetical protein